MDKRREATRWMRWLAATAAAALLAGCESKQEVCYDGSLLWFQNKTLWQKHRQTASIEPCDITPTLLLACEELRNCFIADTVRLVMSNDPTLGNDGFEIIPTSEHSVSISGRTDVAMYYGTFELLRQQAIGVRKIAKQRSVPAYNLRMLNHWDNLDGTVERGFAGRSIWHWGKHSDDDVARYRAYAKANASIGINATVINNINAIPEILSDNYLRQVANIADELRPYGIRVFLSICFDTPTKLSGLVDADPLNPTVAKWWKNKVDEIYKHIPDFGGFLVKADSENMNGPHDYGRTHADGANMLARALAPHGGTLIWRTFVYSPDETDRTMQAYNEFKPLDGMFDSNVVLQSKTGPIDFQPREPFNPLFGAMPHTQVGIEMQITQEFTGAANHLYYLPASWSETLMSDTYRDGEGSTVARMTSTNVGPDTQTAIAGVANIGDNSNWCGHPMAQANWYGFGRLAWDPTLSPDSIAREWIRQTMVNMPASAESTVLDVMMESRETMVDYMMPLGLHHIFAWGHHYGPEPWLDVEGARHDWMPKYYHCADEEGLGRDRSSTGCNAIAQYNEPLDSIWGDIDTCPEKYLLWFHHVSWNHKLQSGQTLWQELCYHYDKGLVMTGHFIAAWKRIRPYIDEEMWTDVSNRLLIQRDDARWWHDACLLYFQQFSHQPIPQKTIYKLDDMQRFKMTTTSFESPKAGYKPAPENK